ncbi:hypothetical protein ACLMJK_001003 [Lecanora helva]
MAKDKDRALNPAAAQRKAEKQKALKKGKAAVAAQRTERYAKRDPRHLESRISDLHSLKESQGGKLSFRDQKQLEEAEKDVARVKKAREALGDRAPTLNTSRRRENRPEDNVNTRGRGGYGGLGKRRREDQEQESSGSETDESVRRIPWPKDTPPPIPRQRHGRSQYSSDANTESLGTDRRLLHERSDLHHLEEPYTTLPPKPTVRTTYESAPQVRDLKKEATAKFIPAAVRRKVDAAKGKGGALLEEEEVAKLEKEGYGPAATRVIHDTEHRNRTGKPSAAEAVRDTMREDATAQRLMEEEEKFARDMKMVEEQQNIDKGLKYVRMEEVSDEDL